MTTLATLVVKLAADIGGFSAEMEKSALQAQKNAEKVGRAWQRTGDQLAGVGSRMTATLTAPIVAGAALSVKASSDEAESWNKVTVVFGDNANAIKEWASDSATSLGVSRNAAYQAAGSFGNLFTTAGVVPDTVLDMSTSLVKLSGDLASFNNADPTEVMQSIQSALVGQVEPMRKYGVMLSQDAIAAKAMQMGLVGTSVDMTKVNGLMIDAEKAQAAYNTAVAWYGKDSLKARDAAQNLAEIQGKIEEATAGSTDKLSDAAKMQAIYALIMENTKTAQGDFINTSDGLANQMRILKADTENTASSIGQILLPYALQLLGWVREAVAWFSALDPSMQKNILIVLGLVAVLGPLLVVIGSIVSAIGVLIPIFTSIGTAIGAVSAPVWLTIAAIIAVLALLYAAWTNNWGGIRTTLEQAWAAIQPILSMVWELFSDSFSRIVAAAQQNLPGLSAAWGTFKSAMTDFWTAVSPILSLLGVVILAVLTVVAGVVVGIINGILTAASIFMSVFDVIVTGVTNILSGIVNIVSGLLDIIVGIFTGNGDLILQGWNKIWTGIQQIVDGIFQTLVGLVAAQLGAIIGFVIGFVQGVVGFFTGLYNTLVGHSIVPDMLNAIKDWFVNVLNTVLSFVSGWVNNLVEPFRVAVSNIINFFRNTDWGAVGRGLVQGIANGISSSASGIADAARRAAQAALDAAKGFLGIHSPSTVAFQQIGVPTGEGQMLGWVAGIEDNLPDVTRSMGNLFGGQTVRMAQSDIAPMPSYVGLDGVSTETGAGGFAGGRGGSVHVTVENKPILSLGDKYEAERVLKPLLVGLLRELGVEVS